MDVPHEPCSVAQTAQRGKEAFGLFKATAGAPLSSIAALDSSPFVLMGDAEGNNCLLQVKVCKGSAAVEVKRGGVGGCRLETLRTLCLLLRPTRLPRSVGHLLGHQRSPVWRHADGAAGVGDE